MSTTGVPAGGESLARELLRLLSETATVGDSVDPIMRLVVTRARARGALLLLPNGYNRRFGSADGWYDAIPTLREALTLLPEGVIHNPPLLNNLRMDGGDVVSAAVRARGTTVGALLLDMDAPFELNDTLRDELMACADALAVVALRLADSSASGRAYARVLSALNTIADPVLVLDDTKCVVMMNPAAEALFGVSIGAAGGLPFTQLPQAGGLAAIVDGMNNAQEWSPEESDKVYAPRLESIRYSDGQTEGYVLALHDITRYKKLNLNQAQFLRIVSHDLRSPLTSMQGFANMLESGAVGELGEKQQYFVQKILSGITQINALVENIQDAGRFDPETGFYDMTRSLVDLNDVVHKVVERHLVPAEKKLVVRVKVDEDVPVINADASMLERAITNLYDNAIKYTPDGGEVEVRARVQDGKVILSVRDSGLGISPENQKLLFQRHVRLPRQEHKRIKGSGLGLFIVRSVAQRHGGDAWVESVEGEGSTFSMSIPLDGANAVVS